MLSDSIELSILVLLIFAVVRSIIIWIRVKKHKKITWIKEIAILAFVFYVSMVVFVTLVPIHTGAYVGLDNIFRSVNLVPFESIISNISQIGIAYSGDALFMIGLITRNVGGNILLLMPLGFLAPILWRKFKTFKNIVLLGLVVSATIEVLQLLETVIGWHGRITDIDDIIFNIIGIMLGFFAYKITFKVLDKISRKEIKAGTEQKA